MPPTTRGTTVAISVTFVLALLVCAALAFISGVATAFSTCGGDSGYPYAARASPAGRLCHGTGGLFATAQLTLPILVFLVPGIYAVVKMKWSGVLIGVAASVMVTGLLFVAPTSLPAHCSDEQARKLSPEDCETE